MLEPIDKCRSCGKPVRMMIYPKTGRAAPIEMQPDARGNITIDEASNTYRIIPKTEIPTYRGTLFLNHFVTCPQAQRWGQKQEQPKKPVIVRPLIHRFYFAGKIRGSDWRGPLLADTSGFMDAPALEDWPILRSAVFGQHHYVGPYFIDGEHSVSFGGKHSGDDMNVVEKCLKALDVADVIFAWIDTRDSYGTAFELGYAASRNKTVWLALDTKLRLEDDDSDSDRDYWFLTHHAKLVGMFASPVLALKEFLKIEQDRREAGSYR